MLIRRCSLALGLLSGCDGSSAPAAGPAASKPGVQAPEVVTGVPARRPGPAHGALTGGVSQVPKVAREREVVAGGCRPDDTCLKYRELVLGGADPAAPLPLVIALHGLGDRPELFGRIFESMGLTARVVLPRGFEGFRGGFRWMTLKPGQDDRLLAEQIREAGARLAAATDELAKTLPTKGRPIVTGFSQGGMLSFYLATHHPKTFARAVPIAGTLLSEQFPRSACKAGDEAAPLVAIHGTADNVIPIDGADAAVKALAGLGCKARLERVEGVGHAAPPEVLAAVEKVLAAAIAEVAVPR